MPRVLENWLEAYVSYATITETPELIHRWCGISALASVLRRRVWFDQVRFTWFPGLYVVIVAPPGILSKSTSADIAMELVRAVPGIKFGPDSVTWQSLVETFAGSSEEFQIGDKFFVQSPITLLASEFGNLIDFEDKKMVNLFITLWDGRPRFEKQTKSSGNDMVEAPWINMLACTTPHWISDNMSQTTIGGGFTSRCIFVYGDTKEKLVPLLDEMVDPEADSTVKRALINDLEHISVNLAGKFILSQAAREWMHVWYKNLWTNVYNPENPDFLNGYLSRKQTHLCKLAMILSISRGDSLQIDVSDFSEAEALLRKTEDTFQKVFSKIGLTDTSANIEKILTLLSRKREVSFHELYRTVHAVFPDIRDFNNIFAGLKQAGYIRTENRGSDLFVIYTGG